MLRQVAGDHERGFNPLRVRPQRRIAYRPVLPAMSGGEPVCEADLFSREAPVQIRLCPLLEGFPAYEVSYVHTDDLLGGHSPKPRKDRVDPLIPVISSDDGYVIRRALEHVPGQIFRPLALGDVVVGL